MHHLSRRRDRTGRRQLRGPEAGPRPREPVRGGRAPGSDGYLQAGNHAYECRICRKEIGFVSSLFCLPPTGSRSRSLPPWGGGGRPGGRSRDPSPTRRGQARWPPREPGRAHLTRARVPIRSPLPSSPRAPPAKNTRPPQALQIQHSSQMELLQSAPARHHCRQQ